MAQLNIFISSTCYDLSQIRKDLREAILGLGHKPMMSEDISFPIDPNSSNTENCIRAVKDEADIFVLIIGSHYGAEVKSSGKSITNTEYLTAVEKGIPIYTFTLDSMVNGFAIWKDNPSANFKGLGVDDNRVFEFINQVRVKSEKWNFKFNNAQDIISTLTTQLSILLKKTLQKQIKIDNSKYSKIQSLVSAKSYNYLVEKEDCYETKFLLQNMQETIDSCYALRNDYKYSILFKSDKQLDDIKDVFNYCQLTLSRFSTLINSLNSLFEKPFHVFFGELGVPSDIEGLYYVAVSYGKIYHALLDAAIEVRSVIVDDKYKRLLDILSEIPAMAIDQMEKFPAEAMSSIDEAIKNRVEGEKINLTIALNISIDNNTVTQLTNEMARLSEIIGYQ